MNNIYIFLYIYIYNAHSFNMTGEVYLKLVITYIGAYNQPFLPSFAPSFLPTWLRSDLGPSKDSTQSSITVKNVHKLTQVLIILETYISPPFFCNKNALKVNILSIYEMQTI